MSGHEGRAKSNRNACRACHGMNGEGMPLSRVPVARTIGTRSFARGEQVTCISATKTSFEPQPADFRTQA